MSNSIFELLDGIADAATSGTIEHFKKIIYGEVGTDDVNPEREARRNAVAAECTIYALENIVDQSKESGADKKFNEAIVARCKKIVDLAKIYQR